MKSSVKEVFGIAGSGKTTYATNHELYDQLKLSRFFKVPIFLWAVLEQTPVILKVGRVTKSTKSIRHMCFIMYKLKMIGFFKRYRNGSYIYDQGPIYNLAMLQKRINSDQHEQLEREIRNITNRIRDNLDESIYLVCDIETAIDRVLSRDKDHIYKKMTREKACNDLNRWKEAYDSIAEQLSSRRIEIDKDIRSNGR